MNNLNSVLIEGNMVKDPVYSTAPDGTPVCTFSLVSNRSFKKETGIKVKEVSFFDVETWSKLAEYVNSQGKEGRGIRVIGCLKQNRWADKDGKEQSNVIIVAEHVEFRPEDKDNGK